MKFLRFSDAATEISALKELNADLEAQNADLSAKVSTLTDSVQATAADLEDANERLETVTAELGDEVDAQAEALTEQGEIIGSLTSDLESATALLETFDAKVTARALEYVASIGHEPVEAIPSDETPEASLISQYNAITDPAAKSTFWNQHKQELLSR